jgi:phage tail sheath gpL-like
MTRVPRTAAGASMLVALSSRTKPVPQEMIDLICAIEAEAATPTDSLDALRAQVVGAAMNHEIMHSGTNLPRCGLCSAVRALRAEGSSKPPDPEP